MRVNEFRELGKDFHDLVRTLSAGCHHDDVGITLLCNRVLKHSLSATERTRNEACTAFGDRIESVNDSDTCLHDSVRPRFLLVALDSHFHRPFLNHCNRNFLAILVNKHSNSMVNVILSGLLNALYGISSLE